MAVSQDQIKRAYQIAFGADPSPSEIRDIQANPQFWGSTLDTVLDRLTSTQRFAEMPVNEKTIDTLFRAYLGSEPTPQEKKAVLENKDFWGSKAGVLKSRIQDTARYKANPGIKITGQMKDKDLNMDLLGMGMSQDVINGMNADQKAFYGAIGKQMVDNIEKSIPAPTTFNAKVLRDLYTQAKNNPKIEEFYKNLETRKIDEIVNGVARMQEDFTYLEQQQSEAFAEQAESLLDQTQQAGMLYSGVRKENERKLKDKQIGVISSSRRQAKRQLEDITRSAEELLGTKAVEDLRLQIRAGEGVSPFADENTAALFGEERITATPSAAPVSRNESQIGQQRQAEVTEEFERLKAERNLLTNPLQ